MAPPDQKPKDARSLAESILRSPKAEKPAEDRAQELIELYFELETTEERELLLEELTATDSPLLLPFFSSMLDEDEDASARAFAAAELAKRGIPKGLLNIRELFRDPANSFEFELALRTLQQILGDPFFEVLEELLFDNERPLYQRLSAIGSMETLSAGKTSASINRYIAKTEPAELPIDLLEAMSLSAARLDNTLLLPAIEQLQKKLKATTLAEDDKEDLRTAIEQAKTLLR